MDINSYNNLTEHHRVMFVVVHKFCVYCASRVKIGFLQCTAMLNSVTRAKNILSHLDCFTLSSQIRTRGGPLKKGRVLLLCGNECAESFLLERLFHNLFKNYRAKPTSFLMEGYYQETRRTRTDIRRYVLKRYLHFTFVAISKKGCV